ncbi:MAG: AIR synthase related protein [Candidatus Methanomethyliaceae archaeon]|nr:AIR synthase related protein [Candidatus Methanomethyliaceae archaeon]MDD1766420.1 AIR synthase related protein [Candidatus Methanomethyliaceae archaeon]
MEDLVHILASAKSYKGFSRKAQIGEIVQIMGESEYDDAGILELGDQLLVVSTDGITEDLVRSDPWFAGYYSVLVNVNDVVVKGAKPLGYVNVISSGNHDTRVKIAKGIRAGLDKYDLRLLKGHTHPDSSYEAIDAAVVGIAKRVARATTAVPGDPIVMAIDLDGSFGIKGWVKCFDSTLKKTKPEITRILSAVRSIIESGYIEASRDMSAPGILGTLTMLCEASSVGAEIDLGKIPKPENIQLSEWLTSYPAMGFIFAINSEKALGPLKEVGLKTEVVGRFTREMTIKARLGKASQTFMDLTSESIFGLK